MPPAASVQPEDDPTSDQGRIVLGVLEPDRGEVRWRGRPVDAETRRRFGYMPEDHGQTFFPLFARWQAATSTRSTRASTPR
jgi:ABC-type Mn2+/Zn2+ transport system ATPase subunit